jgi:DNA-binding response OmpR family regulator
LKPPRIALTLRRFAQARISAAIRRRESAMDIRVYEEDDLTRALLEQWLGEAGYRVRVGAACRAGPQTHSDLVIVNVSMPKQAGRQCIRHIREAHPQAPLIAISAQFRSGLSASGATAQALGVLKVIAKPLVRSELLEAVRGIIGEPD